MDKIYKQSEDQNSFCSFHFELILFFNHQRLKKVIQRLVIVLTLVMRYIFISYRPAILC